MSQPSTPAGLEREVLAVISGSGSVCGLSYSATIETIAFGRAHSTGAEAVVRTRRFADHIRAAVRLLVHKLLRVLGRDGQHIRIVLAHKAPPRRIGVTDDDPVRSDAAGAQHGADARWARHRG